MNIEEPNELLCYLRENGRLGAEDSAHVTVLSGGVSNRTVLVRFATGTAWVLKQALPKLRVAREWFCDPRRIEREALGLQALAQLTPPGTVPAYLFSDPAHHLLAMTAVPEPHANWKSLLLAGQVDLGHVQQFGALLGRIHRDSARAQQTLNRAFDDCGYFEALRLVPYYETAAGQNPETRRFYDELMAETRTTHLALVHGDYSPKNVLVHDDRLILLDHEVVHFGDPAFDVGFSLTHLLSKAHRVVSRRAALVVAAREYWGSYRAVVGGLFGTGFPARAVRHTLACLLARVDGCSPLEYLSAEERIIQRKLVIQLMRETPPDVPRLIEVFARNLECAGKR